MCCSCDFVCDFTGYCVALILSVLSDLSTTFILKDVMCLVHHLIFLQTILQGRWPGYLVALHDFGLLPLPETRSISGNVTMHLFTLCWSGLASQVHGVLETTW